ncbi:MAG: C40 family peptidase [Gammaproteobacteria bacterium]|nr:C40 family peptidase [Gammaproteobacteria bacterium]
MNLHPAPHRPRLHLPPLLWLAAVLLALSGCASRPPVTVITPEDVRTAHPVPSGSRGAVVQTAKNMVGTPYRYGGSSPRGFDCSGLVSFSFAQAGIPVPRTADRQFRASRPVGDRNLLPGDLIFFDIGGRRISHVGIYVGDGRFVHAPSTGKRVSVESLASPYWRDRIVGAGHYFRIP